MLIHFWTTEILSVGHLLGFLMQVVRRDRLFPCLYNIDGNNCLRGIYSGVCNKRGGDFLKSNKGGGG